MWDSGCCSLAWILSKRSLAGPAKAAPQLILTSQVLSFALSLPRCCSPVPGCATLCRASLSCPDTCDSKVTVGLLPHQTAFQEHQLFTLSFSSRLPLLAYGKRKCCYFNLQTGRTNHVNTSASARGLCQSRGSSSEMDRTEFTGQLWLPCLLNYPVM